MQGDNAREMVPPFIMMPPEFIPSPKSGGITSPKVLDWRIAGLVILR